MYCFASLDGLYEFARDPQQYYLQSTNLTLSFIQQAIEVAKSHASLIELLQLYSQFPTIEALENV